MKFSFIFIFLSQIALFLTSATYSGFPVVMQVSSIQLTFLQSQHETLPFILLGFTNLIWTFCCLKNSHPSTSLVFLSRERKGKTRRIFFQLSILCFYPATSHCTNTVVTICSILVVCKVMTLISR